MENVGLVSFLRRRVFCHMLVLFSFFCNVFLLILVGLAILMDWKDFFC